MNALLVMKSEIISALPKQNLFYVQLHKGQIKCFLEFYKRETVGKLILL